MYTSTIGKIFLKAYNRKYQKEHTGKSFFIEVFVPLFFDHQKYMMTARNSPLENPKLSWGDMIKGKKPFEPPEQRRARIDKMIRKIESEEADASIAVGYGVSDNTAATTGQVTNINFSDNKENVYLSWIGDGLGIGVSGGLTISFNYEQILLDIFDGWKYYRDYLERYPWMKGNQINTWNAHWIVHRYDDYLYDVDNPTSGMNPVAPVEGEIVNLPTISWVPVVMGIARYFPIDNLVGYLYSIGKSNTTIGFMPFRLQDIISIEHLYSKMFGLSALSDNRRKIESLLGTALGLRIACQAGTIGIPAMEPKGLKAYFSTGKGLKKIVYKDDNEQKITINIYLIWILAMLNNEKLWTLSEEFARLLLQYEAGAGKMKRDRTNQVGQLFASVSVKQFLNNLIPIIENEKEVEGYRNMGKVFHEIPKDNFPYFNTLIRFQYALLNK